MPLNRTQEKNENEAKSNGHSMKSEKYKKRFKCIMVVNIK